LFRELICNTDLFCFEGGLLA